MLGNTDRSFNGFPAVRGASLSVQAQLVGAHVDAHHLGPLRVVADRLQGEPEG
jgi:hypothetical protein